MQILNINSVICDICELSFHTDSLCLTCFMQELGNGGVRMHAHAHKKLNSVVLLVHYCQCSYDQWLV
jgi:hypothetical protein